MRGKFLTLVAGMLIASPAMAQNLIFGHHMDNPLGAGLAAADLSVGNSQSQIPPPNGPGGTVVTGGKFGNALDRSTGGRAEYQTFGNWNNAVGTIEMWLKGPGISNAGAGFRGLWSTDTDTGNGADTRMYIYNTGAGRTLGAYMNGGSGTFWEIEQAIPVALLDNTNWHHVAWSYDTAAGVTATWWDGQLLRNTPDAGVVNFHNSTNTLMHIGENQAGSATWPGLMDEFMISDYFKYPINGNFTPPTAPFAVPEPASLSMLAIAGVGLLRRRK